MSKAQLVVNQYLHTIFPQKLTTVTAFLESVEGREWCRNDFMINLHKSYVAELRFRVQVLLPTAL